MAAFAQVLAPGSYVIGSVGFAGDQAGDDFARTYNAQDGPRIYSHSWEQITAMFGGLALVPPGLVETSAWQQQGQRPEPEERSSMIVAGVARKV